MKEYVSCMQGVKESALRARRKGTQTPLMLQLEGWPPVLCKGQFRLCRSRVASVTSGQPSPLPWESSHGQYVQESVICFPIKFYFWTLKFGFHIISGAMKCYYIILFIVSLIGGD